MPQQKSIGKCLWRDIGRRRYILRLRILFNNNCSLLFTLFIYATTHMDCIALLLEIHLYVAQATNRHHRRRPPLAMALHLPCTIRTSLLRLSLRHLTTTSTPGDDPSPPTPSHPPLTLSPKLLNPRTRTLIEKQFESWLHNLKPRFTQSDIDEALRAQPDPDIALDLFRWTAQQLKVHYLSRWHQLWRMFCSSMRIDLVILISMLAGRKKPIIFDLF
ncbi:hypothetical protein C2S51_008654 [Perilla frutescens var. frutescens]|nr:hypothetical protein C2S51_008654 [Perilla frutescens var. frutescens]